MSKSTMKQIDLANQDFGICSEQVYSQAESLAWHRACKQVDWPFFVQIRDRIRRPLEGQISLELYWPVRMRIHHDTD